MNEYRVVYKCSDGYKDEVIICAANRIMALEIFKEFEFEGVVAADAFLIIE